MSEKELQEKFEKYFIKKRPGILSFMRNNRIEKGYRSLEINEFYNTFKAGFKVGINNV